MIVDVLLFFPHPDDAELTMGGTVAKLVKNNMKVGIIDLTRGELGTRGNAETRHKEATKAASILKVTLRENLDIPDGNIEISKKNELKLVSAIRKHKPKLIFAPYFNDRHPDHVNASILTKKAYFSCGLPKVKTYDNKKLQEAHRPKRLFYSMHYYEFIPSFIIDISETFEDKMKAVSCYGSQFYNPKSVEPETFISRPNFLNYVEARALTYGFKIGKAYGEPFFCEEEIELDIIGLLKNNF
jgi:bacillithiol biosynthesis deacetylase BshB1